MVAKPFSSVKQTAQWVFWLGLANVTDKIDSTFTLGYVLRFSQLSEIETKLFASKDLFCYLLRRVFLK